METIMMQPIFGYVGMVSYMGSFVYYDYGGSQPIHMGLPMTR